MCTCRKAEEDKKGPFFLFSYADDDILVARGRGRWRGVLASGHSNMGGRVWGQPVIVMVSKADSLLQLCED